MSLLSDLLALLARKVKRREMKKKRSEKKKNTQRTSEILEARRSKYIKLPPDEKD